MYFSAVERSPFCGGERNRGRRGHHGRQARRRVHPHESSLHALRRVRPRDRRSGSVPQVRQRRLLFRGVQVREESDSEPPKLPATPAFTLSNQLDRKTLVLSKLQNNSIVTMQADWTKPNNKIANFITQFNRYGIPFNVVFGPAATSGIVLPELLSSQSIFTALEMAKTLPQK